MPHPGNKKGTCHFYDCSDFFFNPNVLNWLVQREKN